MIRETFEIMEGATRPDREGTLEDQGKYCNNIDRTGGMRGKSIGEHEAKDC